MLSIELFEVTRVIFFAFFVIYLCHPNKPKLNAIITVSCAVFSIVLAPRRGDKTVTQAVRTWRVTYWKIRYREVKKTATHRAFFLTSGVKRSAGLSDVGIIHHFFRFVHTFSGKTKLFFRRVFCLLLFNKAHCFFLVALYLDFFSVFN